MKMEFLVFLLLAGGYGYPPLQIFMVIRRRARLRACIPLPVTVPIYAGCISNYVHGHYHALMPIWMIGPLGSLYLITLLLLTTRPSAE